MPTKITQKFNPEISFGEKELLSMLYYLGYLTIVGEKLGRVELKVPNQVMKEIYAEYFLELIERETELKIEENEYDKILQEIALEGKMDTFVKTVERYLKNLSNRDYERFNEKYVKLIFYSIAMNFDIYDVKSEMEIERGYSDLILSPREEQKGKGYYSIIIEFKYLKKEEEKKLKDMQESAKEQLERYCNTRYIKDIKKISKYVIIAINDKLYVEKI